jgi:hypothetical protein
MGALASSLATPWPFTTPDGKTLLVSPWKLRICAAFERYLEKYAYDGYYRAADKLSPADAEKLLAGIMRDVAAGQYSFGSELVGKALESPTHVRYMFFLCVKDNHPEAAWEQIEEIARANYGAIVRAMNLANLDPNRRRAQALEWGYTEATLPGEPYTTPVPTPSAESL